MRKGNRPSGYTLGRDDPVRLHAGARRLRSAANRDHVAVADHVVAPLGPAQPTLARLAVAARLHQLAPVDHLGPHEAGLDLGVHLAGCVPGAQPAAQRPRSGLAAAVRGEEGDQVEQLVGRPHQPHEPRLPQPQLGAHLDGPLGGELPQFRLDPGADPDAAGVLAPRVLHQRPRGLAFPLVQVGDVEHRLGAQRLELRGGARRQGRGRHRPRRLATAEALDHELEPVAFRGRLLGAGVRQLSDSLQPALRLFEIGEQQLGVHQLGVGDRVDSPLGMRNPLVAVGADHVADRVGLADLGQEAIAQPLAGRGALHQPGDVSELDRLRDLRARTGGLGNGRQAMVGDLDDGDVRLHRRERVDGGLRRGPRKGVEERRLARVGQADDADLHERPGSPSALATRSIRRSSVPLPRNPGQSRPIATPSAAPPSTSDG